MFEELSLHILDIAMNALAAGARTIRIGIRESPRRNVWVLRIRDDGRGMDTATRERVLERRLSTKPGRQKGIGLGLALLRQTCEMCGGRFRLRSEPGRGTTVTASMRYAHVDRPPLGDLTHTLLALCAAGPEVDVRLDYRNDQHRYRFSSQEPRHQRKEPTHHEPRGTQATQRESPTAGCPA